MYTSRDTSAHPSSTSDRNHNGASRFLRHASTNATSSGHFGVNEEGSAMVNGLGHNGGTGEDAGEEDPRQILFKEQFIKTERRILDLFSRRRDTGRVGSHSPRRMGSPKPTTTAGAPASTTQNKRPARVMDEDYGDDDDDDEEDDAPDTSPLKGKGNATYPSGPIASLTKIPSLIPTPTLDRRSTASSNEAPKSAEDVRKKLEADKKAAEENAKRSSYTLFYTLESDRDAMLDQQKLDELDREVATEGAGHAGGEANNNQANGIQQGTLSSANLGSSSLALKHLIARIDQKRNMVKASDAELRQLMAEVRKNRSKWASDTMINQEELYESCEKVLMELKAKTEYSTPFLNKVNRREVPDYYNVIKHPMDIGSMLKKLKNLAYKSKKEFVDDLNLIWNNCLQYNSDERHPFRKKAKEMQKETAKLVPLIPDLTVQSRAEVEAEERKRQNDAGDDGSDSDDDRPIKAIRSRKKAPQKGGPTSTARKAPPSAQDGTASGDVPAVTVSKPSHHDLPNGFLRADSDAPMEGSVNGLNTPPPGNLTPFLVNGVTSVSQPDGVDSDPVQTAEELEMEDPEFKTWKQVTKKDRAMAAADRNRLFKGDRLNPEEPAILRTKARMRRWMRQQKWAQEPADDQDEEETVKAKSDQVAAGETLAEGIEGDEDSFLPDYYDPVAAIPDLDARFEWVEGPDGQIVEQNDEYLRAYPAGQFIAPKSALSESMNRNMRQMQETRKIAAKISMVKQLQLQTQMYQNQFQKYDPEPFVDADIQPTAVSEDGPIMSQELCRAGLQRSVAKIFYHAGFEETQPGALDAITDVAADYMAKLVASLKGYREAPKVPVRHDLSVATGQSTRWKPRYTAEEAILHTLSDNNLDMESLESYVKEDVDRLGTKLQKTHEAVREYYAELLRPALEPDAGADGVGAFRDNSDQFVSGDFAYDLDEDFFGFRELGLDKEFGLGILNVPLHLLQNKITGSTAQGPAAGTGSGTLLPEPSRYEPVTLENVTSQIGLVQEWFKARLRSHGNLPLVEDDELPAKQRFPKPRLPPNGKITSPRKRPIREQQALAKKKRKLEEGRAEVGVNGVAGLPVMSGANGTGATPVVNGVASQPSMVNGVKPLGKPVGKLKLDMPKETSVPEPEKDAEHEETGMISPESIGVV